VPKAVSILSKSSINVITIAIIIMNDPIHEGIPKLSSNANRRRQA
jgi:hypothetical protein